MDWSADGPTQSKPNNPLGISRRYSYRYDALNRLTHADYSETKQRESPMYVEFINQPDYSTSYAYDINSNIKNLTGKGLTDRYTGDTYEQWTFGTVDSLSFVHDGNKLLNVSDKAGDVVFNAAFNFNDSDNEDAEYNYDANGNMTQDMNKGIDLIEYNYLNLPVLITFTNGHVTEYVYEPPELNAA